MLKPYGRVCVVFEEFGCSCVPLIVCVNQIRGRGERPVLKAVKEKEKRREREQEKRQKLHLSDLILWYIVVALSHAPVISRGILNSCLFEMKMKTYISYLSDRYTGQSDLLRPPDYSWPHVFLNRGPHILKQKPDSLIRFYYWLKNVLLDCDVFCCCSPTWEEHVSSRSSPFHLCILLFYLMRETCLPPFVFNFPLIHCLTLVPFPVPIIPLSVYSEKTCRAQNKRTVGPVLLSALPH